MLGNEAPTLPRPPIPERYQLQLTAEGRAPMILLEQLPSHATADQLRHLLDALLDATEGPRMRVEAMVTDSVDDDVADDGDLPSARQKRTVY